MAPDAHGPAFLPSSGVPRLALALTLMLLGAACAKNPPLPPPEPGLERMIDQPRVDPYTPSEFFSDGAANRPTPPMTVPRAARLWDEGTATGHVASGYLRTSPFLVDMKTLQRGRQRYGVACAACHGMRGDGATPVARAMSLVVPRNLLVEPYRSYPIGRVVEVEGTGYGVMPSYADMLDVEDRWAVAAYVQVLQLADGVALDGLTQARHQDVQEHLP